MEGKHWQQLVAGTPRANPINLLILLFLAPGYVFLPNTESMWARCGFLVWEVSSAVREQRGAG